MKQIKTLLFAALVAFAAIGCNDVPEGTEPNKGGKLISLRASMDDFTRVTGSYFEEGDKVGLHIITNKVFLDNALFTTDNNGELKGSRDYYWYEDEEVTADIVAYYPYDSNAPYGQGTMEFSIDGSYASDLLLAHTTAKPTSEAINLPFKHAFSKIGINITNQTSASVISVAISDIYNNVEIDLLSGKVTTIGQQGDCLAQKVSDTKWEVIIAPQSNVAPELTITTSDNFCRTYTLSNAATFESGKMYSAPITITPDDDVDPAPQPDAIGGLTYNISAWGNGGELTFEQTGNAVKVEQYKVYVNPSNGWNKYYLYTWDGNGTEHHGNWPGTQITEREEKDGVNYYVYTLEEELYGQTINYIINNGSGQQSDDLSAIVNQDIYFGNNEGGNTSGSDVAWGIVGSPNGWGATADTPLTLDSTTGLYTAKGVVLEANAEIKIRGNNVWDDNYNYGIEAGTTVSLNSAIKLICGNASQNILVSAAGTYDIYFDLAGSKLYIMTAGNTPAL